MPSRVELQMPRGQVLNEKFASRVALQTRKLDDSLPVRALLLGYYEDSHGRFKESFPPKLDRWFDFYFKLDRRERVNLTKILRVAAAGFGTIEELREASFSDVYNKMSPNGYPIRGMGLATAGFLKIIFKTTAASAL